MAEVRLAFDLAHPSGRVWRALTDAQLLCEWFMPTDLTPRAGSRFTFHPGTLPGFLGPVTGEVVAVEPASRLVMLWQGEKLYTRVTWDLAPVGAACRLSLTQTGFIGAPAALRCEGLTTTYRDLFGVQLPLALDRLAAEESGAGAGFASGESTASPRAPAPRAPPGGTSSGAGRTAGRLPLGAGAEAAFRQCAGAGVDCRARAGRAAEHVTGTDSASGASHATRLAARCRPLGGGVSRVAGGLELGAQPGDRRGGGDFGGGSVCQPRLPPGCGPGWLTTRWAASGRPGRSGDGGPADCGHPAR